MGKYVTKNRKEHEKRVVSVRIRRPVFEAFKGASLTAQKYGYSMSLSGVFETALEDAITEFKEISGIDFQDIERCQKLMPENKLYRPPYGKLSFNQIQKLKKNYKLILWDVLSMDFSKSITTSRIKNNVLNNVENGSIIVFHNNQKCFKNLKSVLMETITELKKRGFTFSTIW